MAKTEAMTHRRALALAILKLEQDAAKQQGPRATECEAAAAAKKLSELKNQLYPPPGWVTEKEY